MPWSGVQVGGAVMAAGKRSKDSVVTKNSDVTEDGPSSAVDGNRASSVLTAARGPVSIPPRPDDHGAGRPDQRLEFLPVFAGSLAHQTAPGSRPETPADSSLDRAERTFTTATTTATTTTATVTHGGGGGSLNSRSNISIISSSYPSMENMRSCVEFPHSLLENSTVSENETMQESLLSAGFAKSENVDLHYYDTSARDTGRNEIDYEAPPSSPPVDDPCQADAVSGVVPAAAAALTVGCSQSLADRIEGARQCCSAMRVDIGVLSARCDTLSSRLHDTRAHRASLPFRAHCVTTAGTLTSVSLAVDVRQTTSRVRVSSLSSSSSFLPSAFLSCSSVSSPSRPEITDDGSVTDSSRTSLSILQRFETELSVRLEELTAYVSSSDMQAEQTQEDEGASAHTEFTDGRPRTCPDLRDSIPVSSGCAPASHSLLPSATKEPKGLRKEGAFLRSTSVMLSPPLSDESSSQDEDEASRQRSEAGVPRTAVAPWAGHEDCLSTTPVLYAQSFGSDFHTPAIEALTCLESFSDSGRLKLFLPTAVGQSLLQSSVMILTPPPSDHSAASDDQSARADGGHHSPESQAAQPDVKVSPEQHTPVSDCSNSDWKDYYAEKYWSCPSPSSKFQDSDVPTKDQAHGGLYVEKLPRIHHACKEQTSKTSETEPGTTADNCEAKNGLDVGAQKETPCSACIPMPGTNTESGVGMASVHSLVQPQGASHGEHRNINNFECEPGTLSGIQKQHRKVLLEAPQKSLNNVSPYSNSKQDKKDNRDSAEVLGCLSHVHATNVLKSMPSKSIEPCYMESDLMSENRFQEIINLSEDIQEAVDPVKGKTNSVMRKSGHLHQTSSIPELSVLPEPPPQNNLNLPENPSTTKTQSFAARKEAGTATRASVQIASSASSSERTDVGSDGRGQTQQILNRSNDPAMSKETSKGVTQTVSSTVARSLWQQHAYSLSAEESRAGKWRPQQKRSRQHRPARPPHHLFQAQAQAPCSAQSHGAEGTVQATDDASSTEQSYRDLENMSCSFNFLREASSPALKDVNNNVLLPVNICSTQTCIPTLSGEVQATQGHESLKADTAAARDNCVTTRTPSTRASDTAPPQQNRTRAVSMSELKTRMYMVTKVKAMEVGLRVQQYSSGQEHGTADSQGYFTYTTTRQNEEYRCSKTEVTFSACKKAQEQAVSARNTFSDVTYNKSSQKQHALSCIAEGETERACERTTGSSQGRVTYVPQITEPAEGRAVKHARCSDNPHSGVPRIRDRQEGSSAEQKPLSLTQKPTAVFQEPLPATAAGEKHKPKPRRSSNSQDCSSVSARKSVVQDTVANLSFDNHLETLSASAPAVYRANCEVLTSTPVVASQRKDGNMMHDFFNPSQSVEESCIWEMSAKAHLTSQNPHKPVNVLNKHGDSEAQNDAIDNNGKGNVGNPDSPEHQRKTTDPPKVEASPTSVEIQTQNITDHTNRSSHLDAPPAHAPNPLPSCGGTITCSAKKERDGQTRQRSGDGTKTSHAANPPETMAVAAQTAAKEDSSILERFPRRRSQRKTRDQLGHLSVFTSSAKGKDNSNWKPQDNVDIASGPPPSKPHERAESCPEVFNEADEKTASEARTAKAGVHESSEDLRPASSDDGRLAPAKRVPVDLLSVRPRPKPLLPTPLYRRSPLSSSTPPCPHCLTLMQHSGPGLPPGPGAGDWFLPCPRGCGCAHADRCLHRPLGPSEGFGAWGRAYNGPAAICVHHGGSSQSSLPPGPRSQSGPPDAGRERVACGFLQQAGGSRPQEHRAASPDTAGGVTAAQVPAEEPPTRESGTGGTTKARRKSAQRHQDAKPENPGAQHQQAPAVSVTVSKADAEREARLQTSRGGPPSCGGDGDRREMDMDVKEDVVPLLVVTWTLLLLSLTVAVRSGHTHRRSRDQQQ